MSPRAAPHVHGDHPGRERRLDVVVDTIADVRDLLRLERPASSTTRAKNAGDGFSTCQRPDEPTKSTCGRRSSSTDSGVFPTAPTRRPLARTAARHGSASG